MKPVRSVTGPYKRNGLPTKQQVQHPKIGVAVLSFLLAALALVVACRARSPSGHDPIAASPPRRKDDVPARSTPIPAPSQRDAQQNASHVLVDSAPKDDAFHRQISVPSSDPARSMSARALDAAVRRSNVASFALWSAFAEHQTFVASPYSIRAALGLVYLASGGQSRKRLQSRLVYPERADDLAVGALDATARAGSKARVEYASSLWIADESRLQRQYLERVANSLRVEVHAIDFSKEPERARSFINRWTSTYSRGDTTETLVESTITSRSQAVLVDTMSFDGTWPARFMLAEGLHAWSDENGTVGRITMDMAYGGKCKAVFNDPATASSGDCVGSACLKAVDAAVADYGDSTLSLMVVKPESWKQFIWNENSFLRIWSALQKAPDADFHFPIMKLRSMRDLTQPLLRLGVDASDLSLPHGAVDRAGPKLSLDRIVHQASFQVAAGSPKREPTASEREPPQRWDDEPAGPYFTADSAFYFLVVERATGLILLMGQVVEPPPYQSKRQRGESAPEVPGATL